MRITRTLIISFLSAFFLLPVTGSFAFDRDWDSGHNTQNNPQNPNPNGPGGNNQGGGGDPVNLHAGNFKFSEQDFDIPGLGPRLSLTRYYNSQERYNGPFGYGWHFDPFMNLLQVRQGEIAYIIVKRGEGIRMQFTDNGDGTFSPTKESTGWHWELNKAGAEYHLDTRDGTTSIFNADGQLVSITDRNGNQLTFAYDGQGRLASMTDAANRQLTMSYNVRNKIESVADFTGRTFSYEYDGADNLVKVTDPLHRSRTYSYDSSHRLLGIVDAAGVPLIQNAYDFQNRVTTQTYTGGSLSFSYADDTTTITNRRGYNSSVKFTSLGNPLQITPPSGQTVNFSYLANNPTTVTDSDGSTVFSYDDSGNITRVRTPLNHLTSYVYNQTYDQIASKTDPLHQTTSYEYDARGNLIKVRDALGLDTVYSYDDKGKVTSVTTRDNMKTEFTYNGSGYLTSIKDTIGGVSKTTRFTYDALGNVLIMQRSDGSLVVNEYNAMNQLTKLVDNAFTPALVYEYTYDKSGHIAKITENGHAKTFSYTNNRVTRVTFPDNSSTAYTYNGNDLITQATYALGTISYEYDNMDRLTTVTHPDGSQFVFTYTGDYLTGITGPGTNVTLAYDQDRRLTKITDVDATKETTFSYDDADNRIQMVDAGGGTTTYTYDKLNRLMSVEDPEAQTTTFSSPIAIPGTTIINEIISAANFNENNRLTSLCTARVSGNMISGYSFEYPDVRYWNKSLLANKRWTAGVVEDTFLKRLHFSLRAPFELIR